MNNVPKPRVVSITLTKLLILVTFSGSMFCILGFIGGYLISTNRTLPVALIPSTFTPLQPTQPFPQITNSPLPSEILSITTLQPSSTISSLPTQTPAPSLTPQQGTFNNPVPIGTGYLFPGLGTLTVKNTSWSPGQTGFAIVELSFSCERPAEQECDTGDFMLDALGETGNGYDREFDAAIPEPDFGSFANPPVYGGGVENGYAGFLITNDESRLIMRVRLFLEQGEVFFKISP